MKKLSVFILSVLLLGNIAIFAQPEQGGNRIKEVLKLTPEQEKKFDDLKYEHQQGVIDIQAKIQKNRLELKKMIDDGKIDEKKVFQLTDDNTKLMGDIKHSATKHWLDVYRMLNDEQKVTWTKHFSRMIDRGAPKAGGRGMMQGRGINRHGKGIMGGRGMNNMMGPRQNMR